MVVQQEKEMEKERVKEKTAAIFGGAKPVDTATREKEIEERLQKDQEKLERQLQEREKSAEEGSEGRRSA